MNQNINTHSHNTNFPSAYCVPGRNPNYISPSSASLLSLSLTAELSGSTLPVSSKSPHPSLFHLLSTALSSTGPLVYEVTAV